MPRSEVAIAASSDIHRVAHIGVVPQIPAASHMMEAAVTNERLTGSRNIRELPPCRGFASAPAARWSLDHI
jgi:hypothetical protein